MGGEQAADLWFRTIPLSVLLNIIIPGGVTVLILRTHAKKSNAGQNP
jgi:hypothetical protein